ncbi:nucleoside diphosphate kinase 6 isoform X2 [Chelonus insularis]|uniref:nucleoside diphosphate kinase 6 isoform X2 n=1 Tax=Chelonus insularis TaxID=460826 RepID=UPI00158E7C7D|nr:nucleoside diphosphate kinase 6 isoform X2 [Chelonus insularis]
MSLKILLYLTTIITPAEASLFYEDHRKKFFYNRLVTFMCSGPSDIHILARDNVISKWRELMGPTKVYEAQYTHPETIRGKYGLSDTRNATHGSDSPESVKREIKIFFPNFNVKEWYDNEEMYFNSEKIHFDPELFLHIIDVNCKKETD